MDTHYILHIFAWSQLIREKIVAQHSHIPISTYILDSKEFSECLNEI